MAILNNHTNSYSDLFDQIGRGELKIPQFQRKFVWNLKKSADLVDSVFKGYPIGNFIFWETHERLRHIRNIGNIEFSKTPNDKFVNYVLDGQQRITSIYAVLNGVEITDEEGKRVDYSSIYIDLNADEKKDPIVVVDIGQKIAVAVKNDIAQGNSPSYIKIKDMLSMKQELLNHYTGISYDKIVGYKKQLDSYNFSIVALKESSIDIATEMFTRLNVGGKALTLFQIMVAKTYDDGKKFDLSQKCERLSKELSEAKYDTIPNATILQVISVLLEKECKRSKILSLHKERVIGIWEEAVKAIKSTVDYFKSFYGIPVSKMLPYNALIVPYSYYFHKMKGEKPTGEIKKKLTDLFWRIAFGGRYSSAVESKIVQDIDRINKIIAGKPVKYDWGIRIKAEDIVERGDFSASKSYIKAILAIMAAKRPRNFNDDSDVDVQNDYLQRSNSKNYHHFFPKAYIKATQPKGHENVNNIANITLIDETLNKAKIKAMAPSQYMEKFSKENDAIGKTMATHLIGDFEKFGINDDNFEKFIQQRAKLISKEIEKKLIKDPQEDKEVVYYEEGESEEEVE